VERPRQYDHNGRELPPLACFQVSATPEELKSRIEAGIPGALASVTGDGHHFNAVVTASAFSGMPRIAQHRLVYDVFGSELGDRIHALSLQTRTSDPEETQ
jgi:stress-induced morphogen